MRKKFRSLLHLNSLSSDKLSRLIHFYWSGEWNFSPSLCCLEAENKLKVPQIDLCTRKRRGEVENDDFIQGPLEFLLCFRTVRFVAVQTDEPREDSSENWVWDESYWEFHLQTMQSE